MHRFVAVIVMLAVIGFTVAQLNYSPDWGKRSQVAFLSNGCKPSAEATLTIFKIIQSEAQKLLECEKVSK